MGRITMELLRKRSEHNEGEIQTLEELALHQEKLEKIELIDKVCRNLKILLLQNNAISKIENVSRLKCLEYLNLALNTVERVENLEGCESLRKIDLTLNFVAELTSISSLRGLCHLQQLYLVGNPCTDYSGYRDYVVAILPHLKSLDGREITKTERIKASQSIRELEHLILRQQQKYFQAQAEKKPDSEQSVLNPQQVKNNASDDDDDGDFWKKEASNTPEVRKEMIRRLEQQDEKKKPKDSKKVKPQRKLITAEGKPLNINEAKISFSLHDEFERSQLVLDLAVPKHMCTTLIDADVQPFHVKVTMKGKIFQLVLPEEVKPDSSFAQRSQVTGHLLITMPKVYDTTTFLWQGKGSQQMIDLTNRTASNTVGPAGEPNKDKKALLTRKFTGLNLNKPKSKTSGPNKSSNAPKTAASTTIPTATPTVSRKASQKGEKVSEVMMGYNSKGRRNKVEAILNSSEMPPPLF